MNKIGVVHCESQTAPDIVTCVQAAGFEPLTIDWQQANTFDFNRLNALIISGGPHLLTESPEKYDWIMQKFKFIKNLSLPTLGICLGHQAIAVTLGGSVYRGLECREKERVTIVSQHPVMEALPEEPFFAEDHCEGIILSDQMNLLASSEHYPVEAFVARNKPFVGVQFHPEISGSNGHTVIKNFLTWGI